MPLTTKIQVGLEALLTSALDLSTTSSPTKLHHRIDLANGSGANQANKFWSDRRTLAASGTENLDLAASLTDAFGASITFARVKGLLIRAASANVNNVLVGGHASAAWSTWAGDATDLVVVRPGGLLLLVAPDATAYAVTATTADLLTVANSGAGTGVTYDIAIVGA